MLPGEIVDMHPLIRSTDQVKAGDNLATVDGNWVCVKLQQRDLLVVVLTATLYCQGQESDVFEYT